MPGRGDKERLGHIKDKDKVEFEGPGCGPFGGR